MADDSLRIHTIASLNAGPRLVVLGGVHGDEKARARIEASGRDIRLEVDGGIKLENIARVVAGSAIFGAPDYAAVIDAMRSQLALQPLPGA